MHHTIKNWNNATLFSCSFERWIRLVFFLAIFFVCLGSSYYHLNPNNATLLWDRLPMAIGFMAIFAMTIAIYVSVKHIELVFILLQVIGIGSVLYWAYTESLGKGDLRLYALVQFVPLIVIPFIIAYSPKNDHIKTKVRYIALALGWYAFAKVLEYGDGFIFTMLDAYVSGHSLKHIAASIGVFYLYKYCTTTRFVHQQFKPL